MALAPASTPQRWGWALGAGKNKNESVGSAWRQYVLLFSHPPSQRIDVAQSQSTDYDNIHI